MERSPSRPGTRRAGLLGRIDVGDVLLALVPLLALFPLRNNDLWWHLATGRWIVEHGAVPRVDPFSFTGFLGAWIDGQWLSQLLLYGTWLLGGNVGLVVLRSALYTAVFLLARALLRAHGQRTLFAPVVAAGIALSHHWWAARPSVLSLIGLLALLVLVDRVRKDSRVWPAIPTLFLLMANVHPGFLFALLVLMAMAAAACCEPLLRGWPRWSDDPRVVGRLAAAAALSVPATLVNPYGWRVYSQQLTIAADTAYRNLLDEWAPPPVRFTAFALVMCGCFVALRWRKASPVHLVPIVAASLLATTGVRFVEYFALAAVPCMLAALGPVRRASPRLVFVSALVAGSLLLAWSPPTETILQEGSGLAAAELTPTERNVQSMARRNVVLLTLALAAGAALAAGRGRPRAARLVALWRGRSIAAVAAASLAVAALAAAIGGAAGLAPHGFVEPGRYPVRCARDVRPDPQASPRRTFNRLSWGGWLIWHERLPTFVDGRAWNQPEFFAYHEAGGPRWRDVFDEYGVTQAIVGHTDPVARLLRTSPEWSEVCRDEASVVFRRGEAAAADLASFEPEASGPADAPSKR